MIALSFPASLILGGDPKSASLHITEDWALFRLAEPVSDSIEPRPTPDASFLVTESDPRIVMLSPAGHSHTRL
ncbi:hypothetical protein CCR94_03230 [Rhodoblastus sphagnicola]|uniref:Uncharacterized protein n=1 Tax=Rhodoblastus sphagnicola TaxID=333368 RepID=A0A2S6NEG8_9HYPH|nr:hypothetical protein CCR94_03230 [Rhodoblastus sphagnicola]